MLAGMRALSVLVLIPVLAAADPPPKLDPINPDRPDATDGAYITPKGYPIVELGYRQTESQGVIIRQYGDGPLFRIGLTPNFELRVSPGSYTNFRIFGSDFKGQEDANVGFKYRFHEGKDKSGFRDPSIAMEFGTSLPTGSRFFRERALQPAVAGIIDWSIDDANDLAVNLGYALLRDDGTQFGQGLISASLGHQLSSRMGSFVELYRTIAADAHGGSHTFGDFGVTYQPNGNVQFDAFYGSTVSESAHQHFFGGGVSFRF